MGATAAGFFGGVGGVIPPLPTPEEVAYWKTQNYWPGRPYGPPIAIVLHTEGGYEGPTIAEFTNNSSQLSAHASVSLTGREDIYVDVSDSTWANGIREPGNAWDAHGLPDINPNWLTYSIETEDHADPKQPVTDEQYFGVLRVCQKAISRAPSIRLLLSHRDISPQSRSACCGPRWWHSNRYAQLASALNVNILTVY